MAGICNTLFSRSRIIDKQSFLFPERIFDLKKDPPKLAGLTITMCSPSKAYNPKIRQRSCCL